VSDDDALAALRHEYAAVGLHERDVEADAVGQFRRWLDEALAAAVPEPNAMVLATVDAEGRPSARTVLLKGLDDRGLVFFTNYDSAKARALAANPSCALVFLWKAIGRQVTITGRASRLPPGESDAYFASRPRGARLAAWASEQSRVIAGREVLDRRWHELEVEYRGRDDIPRPAGWGGYVVEPLTVELWQGRPDRLHDRVRYTRRPDDGWDLERLAP
jgi:pyridoxamine 5'-phosphate oxidase